MNYRNEGLDIFRVCSLLLVVIYHVWVITSNYYCFHNILLDTIIPLGGEIGVTAFFVLSGCTIYLSLSRKKNNYICYIKKRFYRVAPEYYVSVFIVIFFMEEGPGYITWQGLKHLIATLTFTQNILPSLGAVNGVLWTMSVTMCFYLLAPLLYKIIDKSNIYVFLIVSIMFTIFSKYIFFHILGTGGIVSNWFWLSRQTIFTDLDNFAFGMVVGRIVYSDRKFAYKSSIFFIACAFIALIIICRIGLKYGIHTDSISGYTWHTLVAMCISIQMLALGVMHIPDGCGYVKKMIHILSSNQYGVYVFHLLIVKNMFMHSIQLQSLMGKNINIGIILFVVISVCASLLVSLCINWAVKWKFSKIQ